MVTDTRIIYTHTFDPWRNLAVEEALLLGAASGRCTLYLWQNKDTVVIGRNQNPWKECRTARLESDGGKLARRLSGGGAVFHDLGNLNFTFVTDRENYSVERQTNVILEAVSSLGINAERSGRNDITADGRKFSGNAFCFKGQGALHHGTLLVASDFKRLTDYLSVPAEKMKMKGIESVRARVVNLTELVPKLTVEAVADSLIRAFKNEYGGNPAVEDDINERERLDAEELFKRYSSWEWRYGKAPEFDLTLENRFEWGGMELSLRLARGKVAEAAVFSDAMDEEYIRLLPGILKGSEFNSKALSERIRRAFGGASGDNSGKTSGEASGRNELGFDKEAYQARRLMAEDLAAWLENKGF